LALVSSGRHRIQQGVLALRPRVPAIRDGVLAEWLTPTQAAAFRGLPKHDQAHLLRVYQALVAQGVTDADLLVAGLLHDLGKSSPYGSVRLIDRVTKVMIARIMPGLLARLTRAPAPWYRYGLWLAAHHPRLGAERAAALGCTPRTCWLIAHHEDAMPDPDPALGLLIQIDRITP
jgi:hypothetical protein